jgi:Protein of unknown function (DUF3891)
MRRILVARWRASPMLVRDDLIVIGQPAHAWLSGQLARAWSPTPREEVCLAATQHDIGMAAWDAAPKLNPETGLPRSFMELELDDHLECWSRAARLVLPQSRYAALLVSMHGTALYERRDPARLAPADVERVQGFLAGQRELQERLLAGLPAADKVPRNQRLVWTWDSLSLGLLLDWMPFELTAVPSAEAPVDIAVRLAPDGRVVLDPWPFAAPRLTVRSEGRRLTGRFHEEAAMRAALAAAPWVTVERELATP